MISSIEWVPAGVADPNPKKYEMSAAEQEVLQVLQEREEQGLSGKGTSEAAGSEAQPKKATKAKTKSTTSATDLPADLRMDEYSDDSDDDDEGNGVLGNLLMDPSNVQEEEMEDLEAEPEDENQEQDGNNPNDSDSNSDSDDEEDNLDDVPDTREFMPLSVEGLEAMKFGDDAGLQDPNKMFDYEDDSEAEEVRLTEDDAMIVVAKTEEDFASLEIHVYDQKTGGLYIHHDVPLPSLPLCLAHGQLTKMQDDGVTSRTHGNFCAVGTFAPGIELWNLDIINPLEPSIVLGGEDTTAADEAMKRNMLQGSLGKKDKMQRPMMMGGGDRTQLRPGSHEGAVMGLSWNQVHRHVIASGSADHTVKIWDVSQAGTPETAVAGTFRHHKDKVQSVVWHPIEATILATGSYDRTVALLDARDGAGQKTKNVKIPSDCEALCWDPFHPEYLTAACENGTIMTWDVRKFSDKSPLWSFVANEFGISDISYNSHVPGMLASCSIDKTVALWDTYSQNNAPQQNAIPRACGSKEMKVGRLYTVSFYPSAPWLLGCAGGDNQLALWDMSCEDAIHGRFASRLNGETNVASTGTDSGIVLDNNNPKDPDFEANMVTDVEKESNAKKKKKKGKQANKKKVHRRGR